MMIPVTGKELVINYSEAAVLVLETERGRGRKQLLPACLRSWGVPDLARTSRSTRLRDMRPKVRPDINPANSTSSTITNMCKKNSDPQHEYSTAILSLSLSLKLLVVIVRESTSTWAPPSPLFLSGTENEERSLWKCGIFIFIDIDLSSKWILLLLIFIIYYVTIIIWNLGWERERERGEVVAAGCESVLLSAGQLAG